MRKGAFSLLVLSTLIWSPACGLAGRHVYLRERCAVLSPTDTECVGGGVPFVLVVIVGAALITLAMGLQVIAHRKAKVVACLSLLGIVVSVTYIEIAMAQEWEWYAEGGAAGAWFVELSVLLLEAVPLALLIAAREHQLERPEGTGV